MTAPLSLSVPTTTAGKVIGGGIGAALGGIGGEDPYFSALSMLHPTLAMAQMANVAYRDEPILPISDAHGAKFPFLSKQGIQRLLNHYAYGMAPEASKAALGRVSASDFLNATVPGEESLARIVKRTGGRYDPYWEGRASHPMLYLDDDGRIIGHEGRHRIAGLSQAVGENAEVPVVFRRYSRSSPEDFEAIPRMVPGQQFESGTGMPFVRENLTPISYANEGALSKYLTEFDVPLTKLRVGLPGDMPEIPENIDPLKLAGGGSVAGAAKRLAQRAMSQAGDVDPVVAPRGALSVVKNKGGNWLTGSVEDALKGLRRDVPFEGYRSEYVPTNYTDPASLRFKWKNSRTGQILTDDEHARLQDSPPINNWIDKQLTRYVKNEMATPEDPIRALAERGILHVPQQRTSGYYLTGNRAAGGFPEEGLAKNELARGWEYMTDVAINPLRAKDFFSSKTGASRFPSTTEANPWLSKVAPETPVYEQLYATTGPLGFDHLIDELSNAMNPESGLPRHLLLDPNSLPRVSVPQAVERVSAINAWRAAQKAEADALRANNAATVLHKEYPEKGMRWVELKAQDADAWEEANKHLGPKEWDEAVANFRNERTKSLQDALKYEGDTMGHCVGGYCDDVYSGRSRIYSLRDAKGQPHVTIEVAPQPRNQGQQDIPDNYIEEAMEKLGIDSPEGQWGREEEIDKLAGDFWRRDNPDTSRIVQIKGKQNKAPNPEYLPFVQDFVKSGQWSDVGDLQNAGLRKLPDNRYITNAQFDEAIHRLTGEGEPSVNAEWFNRQIINDPKWWENANGAFEGFAQGGLVEAMIEQNLDAMVEKQTPRQMSRGGSVRTPIRAKIEKMTSELRQCRN
jgi:hypothetical protein